MRVAIVNYGMGNLASVRKAFEDIGADAFIADRPAAISEANRVVLPGVGAFGDGMHALREAGWVDGLRDAVLEQKKVLAGHLPRHADARVHGAMRAGSRRDWGSSRARFAASTA
jgi:imidazoleglycerol phosphate synthase glutamine amidotransferase subunit HisH